MSRLFSASDARHLISEHQSLLNRLRNAGKLAESYRSEIKDASDALVTQEVLKVLHDIPIDEINRDKRGFRVKALREHGYNTIADIAPASVYSIASVHGVSEDTAYSIKDIVNDIVNKARQGIKIRLSTDNKTPESSRLVLAVSQYRKSQPVAEACQNIVNLNSNQIISSIEILASTAGTLQWFFASKTKKQRAGEAYSKLSELLRGEYTQTASSQLASLEAARHISITDAWNDFTENSVRFFNILEDINPGILGNDDSVYGLPEDLAREIQEQGFFPEGLLCELRRYQEWGVKYILHQERVLLGDEMGLGKTIQAIATMISLRNIGGTHFVVVCPASVITNWCREIRKMSKLSVTKVHGADRSQALNSWQKTGGVAVTTYETTSHFNLPDNFKFDMLVVDEAHYIKNSFSICKSSR